MILNLFFEVSNPDGCLLRHTFVDASSLLMLGPVMHDDEVVLEVSHFSSP